MIEYILAGIGIYTLGVIAMFVIPFIFGEIKRRWFT